MEECRWVSVGVVWVSVRAMWVSVGFVWVSVEALWVTVELWGCVGQCGAMSGCGGCVG